MKSDSRGQDRRPDVSGSRPADALGHPMKHRVALVTDTMLFSGAETYLVRLAEVLRGDWEFVAVLSDKSADETRRKLEDAGAVIELVPGLARRPSIGSMMGLVRRLRRIGPDIVHVNLSDQGDAPAILAAARLWRYPTVATLNLTVPRRNRRREAVHRWLLRSPDRVIGVSDAVSGYLRSARASPSTVHYGLPPFGIAPDARDRLQVGAATFVVGGIGRTHPHKGWDVLCAAAPSVKGRVDGNVAFVVVGDGPCRSSLASGPDCGAVRFLGYREDAAALLGGIDVLVVPSRVEGFGFVALEAMIAGVPVIASEVGGLPEVVGDAGLLVPPDDPGRLADAIVRLATDSDLRCRLAGAGQRRAAEHFAVERMGRETAEIYLSLSKEPHS